MSRVMPGFETAVSLAQHGCNVVFACRSQEHAENAISKVKKFKTRTKCIPMKLDLSSLGSVEKFSAEFNKLYKLENHRCDLYVIVKFYAICLHFTIVHSFHYRNLDILILNAGVFCLPYTITCDGYESTFQICHLSHFYLVKLLEKNILSSYSPRIVVVSSESHRLFRFSFLSRYPTVL